MLPVSAFTSKVGNHANTLNLNTAYLRLIENTYFVLDPIVPPQVQVFSIYGTEYVI